MSNRVIGLRGEFFDDSDGVRTGTAARFSEGTITPTWHLDDHLTFRGDLRFDHANSASSVTTRIHRITR